MLSNIFLLSACQVQLPWFNLHRIVWFWWSAEKFAKFFCSQTEIRTFNEDRNIDKIWKSVCSSSYLPGRKSAGGNTLFHEFGGFSSTFTATASASSYRRRNFLESRSWCGEVEDISCWDRGDLTQPSSPQCWILSTNCETILVVRSSS